MRETDTITLVCFHHAGGGARQYAAWAKHLPDSIRLHPVDLPGHGARLTEAPLTDWPAVVAAAMQAIGTGPWAAFGHSMGALVALESCHAALARGTPPLWLGVAACRPRPVRDEAVDWLDCPRYAVVARLRELGGTPPDVLANDELLDLLLPGIRADLHLCASFAPPRRPALDVPLLAIGAESDDLTPTELAGWAAETRGPFALRMVAGDHFVVRRAPERVVPLVAESIRRCIGQALTA